MALSDDLERIAAAAESLAKVGERVTGILPTEPLDVGRVYLCAYEDAAGAHTWLGLDDRGEPVTSVRAIREAASIAALCELAEETAGGGDLEELRARLRELRETEAPEGIEEAEEAAARLAATLSREPRLATPAYLDEIGGAVRRLEQALGDESGSPFTAAMQQAMPAVERLAEEVREHYKGPLA